MKITKVDIYMLDAGAQRASRRPICCRVWTDEGIYGDGEAGIAFDYAAPAGVGMLQDLSRLIIGMDPMRVDAIWEKLFKLTFWGQGGGPLVFAGISAIDIALMDIKGKALNVPVYELLGGKFRDNVRCYASQLQFGWNEKIGPWGPTQEYVDICKYAMSEGYDAVKIDFIAYDREGKDIPYEECEGFLSHDLYALAEERIAAIRQECGHLDIIMENHGRSDSISAVKLGELCDKYDLYCLEEPTTVLNTEFHKRVQRRIRTPIGSGERIYTRWQYLNFFRDNSIQLVQPDACNCAPAVPSPRRRLFSLLRPSPTSPFMSITSAPLSLPSPALANTIISQRMAAIRSPTFPALARNSRTLPSRPRWSMSRSRNRDVWSAKQLKGGIRSENIPQVLEPVLHFPGRQLHFQTGDDQGCVL